MPLRASVWATAGTIAGIVVLTLASLDIEVSARPMGGGGGMRGMSFGRGVGRASFGHGIGGASFGRGVGAARFGHGGSTFNHGARSSAVHSFGALGGGRASIGSFHAANVARAHQVFGNRVITNAAFHSARVPFRFQGRFFGSPWPWWWGGIVIGWIGPVFWPYAYYDFFDYVFWPYAYDDFWPYAYDDVYYGIYGPYAYSVPPTGVASVDPSPASSPGRLPQPADTNARRRVQGQGSAMRAADVCSNSASELREWPIERISEVVQPTGDQRVALAELKAESAKSVELLKSACPSDLPSIPTGRLAAMQTRLEIMLAAVKTVRPALDRFYQSLTDEQKARFNAIAPVQVGTSTKDKRDLGAFCNAPTPGVTDLPIDRIATAVKPTETQRAALDELREASANAAALLKADCPSYEILTPVKRNEVMEQRLAGMVEAVKTVEPALTKFYDLLSDEQKARFNALRRVERPQG